MKKIIWLIVISLGLASLAPALADTASTSTSPAAVENSVSTLLQAKSNAALPVDKRLAEEISAREKIIAAALDLSLKESANTRKELNSLPDFATSSQAYALKAGYLANLDAYDAYYNAEEEQLANLANNPYLDQSDLNDALKSLASEIKDYRETFSGPQIAAMNDFYLSFYTKDLIATAEDRLNKIEGDIQNLESLGILQSGAFGDSLSQAGKLLTDAGGLDQNAQDIILAPKGEASKSASTPGELIKSSLLDIAKTYDIFLQISQVISGGNSSSQ